jgi:hypothetical protein
MNFDEIEKALISEIKLSPIQAKVFLLIVNEGKMNAIEIASKLKIPVEEALYIAKTLIDLGGMINLSATEFETMHPRFTAVNMYHRICTRENIEFKKNTIVDNIGIALEKPYEDARTNNKTG